MMKQWHSCYDSGWKGIIVPEAFSHPAKMSYGLLKRILEHARDEKWIRPRDIVVDPFGGIGSTGIIGAYADLRVICVELEAKFCKLAEQNFKLHKDAWLEFGNPYPVIIQGDSRRLCEVVEKADCIIGSPPFQGFTHSDRDFQAPHDTTKLMVKGDGYGQTPGQLGSMKPGKVDMVVKKGLTNSTQETNVNKKQENVYESKVKMGKKDSRDRMALQNDGIEPNSDRPILWSNPEIHIENNEKIQNTEKTEGASERQGSSKLQGRQEQSAVSNSNRKGQMPQVRDNGKSGDSPQERRPLRPSAGKSGSAMQSLSSEHNQKEVVGGKESRASDTKKQCSDGLEKVSMIISSPPYAELGVKTKGHGIKGAKGSIGHGCKADEAEYGTTKGNLGNLKSGDVDAIISSPPYAEALSARGGRQMAQMGLGNAKAGKDDKCKDAIGYSKNPENLGNLKSGDVDCVISSPPYEETHNQGGDQATHPGMKWKDGERTDRGVVNRRNYKGTDYGQTAGNIGNDKGDTFWQAAKTIVEQCHQILKPGGHAIWVVKSFVRKKKIVDFPGDWQRLCESVGFKTVCVHHAMLVKETSHQTLFGDTEVKRTERKSFFRRLAESKGSPRIDFEVVLCMEKQPLFPVETKKG